MVCPLESTGPCKPYTLTKKEKVSKCEKEDTYVDSAEIAGRSVPDRKDDPFPEDLEIEVYSFLAGLVHLWILVAVLIIDVLFE